jgi:penicillin-binding protein 1A
MAKLIRYLLAIGVSALGVSVLAAAAVPALGQMLTAHNSTSSLPNLRPLAQRSVMYDAANQVIGQFKAEENRKPVPLAEIPSGVVNAVLQVEDADFYKHDGVSLRSILRASLAGVSSGAATQGGSTITQQLVKNAILTNKKDARRKITEAMYAMRLEDRESKDWILEQYLNTIYFGNGAYGVKAAAETYFGRPLETLTLTDGAFLAGLIRAPGGYDPFTKPERFKNRYAFALQRLVDAEFITQERAEEALAQPLPFRPFVTPEASLPLTYFANEAKLLLLNDPTYLGGTEQERYDLLFKGGLKIYTTSNPVLQRYADEAVSSILPPEAIGRFTAAIASIDPRNGAVRAIVGGPAFKENQFDLAVQGNRQGGSSLKTFVMVAAFERGARPEDMLNGGTNCSFANPGGEKNGLPYEPKGRNAGVARIDENFSKSINCAFVRLGQAVGIENVLDTAKRMGINTDKIPKVPSMPLGTGEVTPFEMASAYGVIAANGVRHEPYYIERIEDADGEIIFQHEATAGVQVLTPEVAALSVNAMAKVVTEGTGKKASLGDRPSAGKTGTSQDNADAWYVGFTPELTTAVWMGSPRPGAAARESMKSLGQFEEVTGGSYPALIWQNYMSRALEAVPITPFAELPAPAFGRGPMRVFSPGTECFGQKYLRSDGRIGDGAVDGSRKGVKVQPPQPAPETKPPREGATPSTIWQFDPGLGTPLGAPLPMVKVDAKAGSCEAPAVKPKPKPKPAPNTTTTVPALTDTPVPGEPTEPTQPPEPPAPTEPPPEGTP